MYLRHRNLAEVIKAMVEKQYDRKNRIGYHYKVRAEDKMGAKVIEANMKNIKTSRIKAY